MAEGVIELLEMVNINHQQRKLLASALGPLELQFQLLLKVSARLQAGQIIGKCKTQQPFIGIFAGQQILRDQRQYPQKLCVFLIEAFKALAEELHGAHHPIAHEQRNGEGGIRAQQIQ